MNKPPRGYRKANKQEKEKIPEDAICYDEITRAWVHSECVGEKAAPKTEYAVPDKIFPNDEFKTNAAKLLSMVAYNLSRAVAINGPSFTQELFKEINNPKPGDMVLEISTLFRGLRDPREAIGTLVSIEDEPIYRNRNEATRKGLEPDEEIPTDRIWTISLDFLDGRLWRWNNAMFIKVKTDV